MKRIAVLSAVVFCSSVASAQQAPPAESKKDASATQSSVAVADDARMKTLEDQVRTLAEEVILLRGELRTLRDTKFVEPGSSGRVLLASSRLEPGMVPAAAPFPVGASAAPDPIPAQLAQTQTYGGATSNAKLLNPDISLIGDFVGTAGHNNISPSPSLEMHESEVGLQAIIDPYARADAFISFGETGVNVEEAYVTFTSLPAGLLLKVGKKRADFGKVNMIHNHALPFIDRPLVTNNLVGGEDGIDDAGFSLSRFLPALKDWFLEGTAQVLRGDSANVFHASRREDVSVVGHVRAYRDLSESTNLDLGISYARGHNANGSDFLTNLYSADATLRWKPLRRAIYHSFLFRTELFWSARDQLSPVNAFQTQHAFGFYSDAEYRLNRRWTLGGRFDRSGHANNASLTDTGFSTILTYWPSEFSQIRGQYRFGHLAVAPNDFSNANELLFQFLFVMGAHGAHPF
ncbi:MAG TPA: hypothetical protein VHF01_05475 [Candidatus Acidoferrum sp.]|nr:hypothetical protein [Candidatus Acidoferrum sp.]